MDETKDERCDRILAEAREALARTADVVVDLEERRQAQYDPVEDPVRKWAREAPAPRRATDSMLGRMIDDVREQMRAYRTFVRDLLAEIVAAERARTKKQLDALRNELRAEFAIERATDDGTIIDLRKAASGPPGAK